MIDVPTNSSLHEPCQRGLNFFSARRSTCSQTPATNKLLLAYTNWPQFSWVTVTVMSQNAPQPLEEAVGFGSIACQNCHSTMPEGLRFCRNCGFRLGEGVAEYTETVRFSNGAPAANGFGMGAGPMAPVASSSLQRRKKRMSGMTWIFLAMIAFFMVAGVVTQIVKPFRNIAGITAPPTASAPRSYFGINSFDTTDGGVTFDSIEAPDSPADKAGLVGGDIITSFDGQVVKDEDELMELLGNTPVGKTVDVTYVRDGEVKTTKLTTISKSDLDKLGRALSARAEGIGRLGIDDQQVVEIPNTKIRGVQVSVSASLPADMAGMKNGDIIIEFAGIPIRTEEELNHRIQRAIPYQTIDIVIMRGAERMTIPVKIGRR